VISPTWGEGEEEGNGEGVIRFPSNALNTPDANELTVSELNCSEDSAITASAAASNTLETYPYDILCGSSLGPSSPRLNVSYNFLKALMGEKKSLASFGYPSL